LLDQVKRPNIVYILADDLGYGDVGCNETGCSIPTPNIDALARRGMRFRDAHATSAVCSPSRYSILTGRYAWKTRLKSGIVWHWDAPLIDPGELTVARLLQDHGYRTACVGKWHLGWDWPTKDGTLPNDRLPYGAYCDPERAAFEDNIDYARQLGGGPTAHGFDSYFGVDVPNFAPYAWFEDNRVTQAPTEPKPAHVYGHDGRAVPGWEPRSIVPQCTRRAVEFIADTASGDQPFFLYFPLTSPHSPIVPNKQFEGRSGIGSYGDFVCEVDWVVGEIMAVLDDQGCADDTLVIFTSDNGPELEVADDEGAYKRARRTRHYSMGPLRGVKRDVWEGGHRVPFIAAWPGVIPEGSTSNALVSLSDLLATCVEVLDTSVDGLDALDSESMLPVLRGKKGGRDSLVLHGGDGRFALRQGQWLFVDAPSGSDRGEPDWFRSERGYVSHDHPGELFNLVDDLTERDNRYGTESHIVGRLAKSLDELVATHRVSEPPSSQPITE
jgi:arylsulfatase A-like enzyme